MEGRRGSILLSVVIIVVGAFLVVGIWYFFAVGFPSWRAESVMHSASSTPASSSSIPAGNFLTTTTVEVATDSMSSLLVAPPPIQSSGTVLAVIEAAPQPLGSIITDPRFQNGISVDDFVKINVLSALDNPTSLGSSPWSRLSSEEFYFVMPMSDATSFDLASGTQVIISFNTCSLYDGWPTFFCATALSVPQHWQIASTSLIVSWQGQNGATVSLAGGVLNAIGASSTLSLHMQISSGYGEFCPNSLVSYGLGILLDEKGDITNPVLTAPTSSCVGPNATMTADVFWGMLSSTTPITVEAFSQPGVQQTFFNLYPLPAGTLFVQTAPTN